MEVMKDHPALRNVTDNLLFPSDKGQMEALMSLLEFAAREGGEIATRVRELSEEYAGTPLESTVAAVLAVQDEPERLVERITNGGFEETGAEAGEAPVGPDWTAEGMPPGWSKWIRPGTTASIVWTGEAAHSGARSVKTTGATACSLLQRIDVQPGEHYVISAQIRARLSEGTLTRISVQWQDQAGAWYNAPRVTSAVRPGETDGWVRRSAFLRVPDGAYRAVIGLSTQNQGPDDYAFFDDVSFQQIKPE